MRPLICFVAAALLLELGSLGSVARADDDVARDERPRRQRLRILERAPGEYWIGVHAVPIDGALRSQLNLEDRLIVRAVFADSPAANAGLAKHDILLKFGERDIRDIDDLLEAVADNKDKGVKLVVLRGGKETALDIQPAERPADMRMRIMDPGVLAELSALPGNVTVTITKQNDEPAKITVQQGDKRWEITENEIDELPAGIREHVRRRLDGWPRRLWTPSGDEAIAVPPDLEALNRQLREQIERAIEQLEALDRRLNTDGPLKALRDELRSLREEAERLRQPDQPAEPPATDARDV